MALILLVLILAILLGGLGFVLHALWWVAAVVLVLWLIGFFILMSFDAQGKLSWVMAVLSVAYVLLLPAYLLGSLIYNLFIRPKKFKQWQQKFMCQHCGAIVEPDKFMGSSLKNKAQELVDSGTLS